MLLKPEERVIPIVLSIKNFLKSFSTPIVVRGWIGLATVLAMLSSATLVNAAETAAEIPVFIATQTGADGKPVPEALTITSVVKLLAEESGLNLVVHSYPWRRAQVLAENGDGLLYGAAATAERVRVYNFSKPLYFANQWLITPAQRPFSFQHWDDLKGKVLSIQSGARFGTEFEERRGKLFTVEENSETIASRLKMLNAGRADALLMDSYRSARQLETRFNCMYADIGKWTVLDKSVDMEPALIAVPKSSRFNAILPTLNEAIERLVKSQGIQKVLEKKSTSTGC